MTSSRVMFVSVFFSVSDTRLDGFVIDSTSDTLAYQILVTNRIEKTVITVKKMITDE